MIELNNGVIELPPLQEQAKVVAVKRAQEIAQNIKQLASEPMIEIPLEVDENDYPKTHLLTKTQGYEPPHPELVKAYFAQLKAFDKKYTDKGVADLIDMADPRVIRRFKSGERPVPYGVWRKFLIATGRAPIDEPKIVGFFK